MASKFLDDGEVATKVLAVLHKVAFEEPSSWDQIIDDANLAAYDDITNALGARGYTLDQINGWDQRVSFAKDIATYHALVNGGVLEAYDTNLLERLDRREQLKTVDVLVDGLIVNPGMDNYRRIASGMLRNCTDIYTMHGPEGGRGRRCDLWREQRRAQGVGWRRWGNCDRDWDCD